MAQQRLPIARLEPVAFRILAAHWFDQCGTRRCPEVGELDPFRVPALAADIVMFEPAGGSFVYRVVGERAGRMLGRNVIGKTLIEVLQDPEYVDLVIAKLMMSVREPGVYLATQRFRRPSDGLTVSSRRLVLPYGEEGEVRRVLTYMLFDQSLQEPYTPGLKLDPLMLTDLFLIEPGPVANAGEAEEGGAPPAQAKT